MAQEVIKRHRCAQFSPQQLVTVRQADERTTLKLIPNTKKCLVPTFASFPLWKHHQVVTWWIFLSSVSHQTLLHRTYTVWTERNYKRKTYGRSTTDGTVSQLFSASSPSSSFGTCFPKIHIFTLEKYELEFVFQAFASSSSFNLSSLSSPVHWLYNSSIRPLSRRSRPHSPSVLPRWL